MNKVQNKRTQPTNQPNKHRSCRGYSELLFDWVSVLPGRGNTELKRGDWVEGAGPVHHVMVTRTERCAMFQTVNCVQRVLIGSHSHVEMKTLFVVSVLDGVRIVVFA